jgi:phenylacetate-coenzyme A ligase PaaK-like adenylate-forming protein
MDVYASFCRHITIPLWAKWEGTSYLKHLQYLNGSQYYEAKVVRENQLRRLKSLLYHASKNSPYYREKFQREGIDVEDIRSFDDFDGVPLLTKEDVRTYKDKILASNVDRYCKFLTSGSTGKPMEGYWDKECSQWKRACAMRSNFWTGYRLGERIYQLYGNPEKEMKGFRKVKSLIRRKLLQRTEILDLLDVSEASMFKFIDKMRNKPPSILFGHTHALYLLAKFMDKHQINDIRPKGMFTAGMPLHEFERNLIEDVFKRPLFNRYGCEELGMIAAECPKQEGLHINTDSHYVECLNRDGKPVPAGELGQIVITDLSNLAMPFIRYKMEDIVRLSDHACSCGRTQPLITTIEGRTADFLVTPEGKLISGISLTDHFAGYIPGVAQIQLVQNHTNRLTLNIVRDMDFGRESLEAINRLVTDFFGPRMAHDCTFVEQIAKGPSGKFRFSICNVKHELL